MSLAIDRLRLRLPAELGVRAHSIALAVGEALAQIDAAPAQRIGRLALPPLRLDAAASDARIAEAVAGALRQALADPRSTR